MRPKTFIAVAIAVIPMQHSHGAILALWNFTGAPGDQASQSVTSTLGNISAGLVVRGTGVTASAAANSISSSSWTTGALDANDYYQFSISADDDYAMTLTTITFAERRSNTGIRNFEVRSSLDSYATAIVGSTTNVPDNDLTRNQTISLPIAFANLEGSVSFRIYGYSSEAGTGTWRLTNGPDGGLAINGTLVPEPQAAILGIVGLIPLLWRRRLAS